ncbi:hypothetical protein BOX15_Mlig006728g1 [Macrostomum lignano]|uniref:Uncharacterized protein n=2 Tax=Macrostomum lignano TaxID=282301 RepID=A0A267FC88_9PLAT|nr:hypothetical protein BOX15_Mlig006728g1 [Macrostomum lignano]
MQQQQKHFEPPRIHVEDDRPPTPPSREPANPPAADAADRNLYLNEPGTEPTEDAASLASEAPAAPATATAGSQPPPLSPQLSQLGVAAPSFTIEINKVVYRIARANISVATVAGQADVSVSLELGAPAKQISEDTSYVKSLKNSFKDSKRAILGAANRIFKPGKSRQSIGSEFFEPAEPTTPTLEMPEECATDSHQLSAGAAAAQNSSSDADAGNRDTFSDAERQPRQTTASSSQENTIESDIVHPQRSGDETGEAQTTKPKETKTKHKRAGDWFSKIRNRPGQDGGSASKNTLQSQQPEPAAVLFPDCVPESLRPTFGITQDTHLVARVFAADCTSTAKQLKQTKESLISDSSKRKMKIKGKSRSVWLSPTAGEKIEVWKLYFNADNRCEKLLAWLPGTDLFGYILPEEVDRDKQFSSAADQSRYEAAIQSLALSQDDYDVEGPPLTPTEPCDEDQGEIYM